MKVIIVGAGSQAATAAEIVLQNRVFEVTGFIDVAGSGKMVTGIKVIGDHALLPKLFADGIRNAVVAVGDNAIRERHYLKLKTLGYNLVNVIHRSAIISDRAILGEGNIIEGGVVLDGNTNVGNNVIIGAGSIIGQNVEIGNNVTIYPGVILTGNNLVKKNACLRSGVVVEGNVMIGKNTTVPPGKIVIRNIPDEGLRTDGRR